MPSLSAHALAIYMQVFHASNNVPRNIASWNVNVANGNGAIDQQRFTLAASGSKTITPLPANKVTIIEVEGGPVNVVITRPSSGGALTVPITELFYCDFEVLTLAFTNAGTGSVAVNLING